MMLRQIFSHWPCCHRSVYRTCFNECAESRSGDFSLFVCSFVCLLVFNPIRYDMLPSLKVTLYIKICFIVTMLDPKHTRDEKNAF